MVSRLPLNKSEQPSDPPQVSAVWACCGQDPELEHTAEQYVAALEALPLSAELIVVTNGSAETARNRLLPLLRRSKLQSTIVHISHFRDESTPLRAGLQASRGEYVALLPQYLQSDPNDIQSMLDKLDEGYDYVASWRNPRVDSRRSSWTSRLFNLLTRWISGLPLHDVNSGLRLARRELTNHVPIYGDLHRFLPHLAASQGFRVTEVRTKHLQERVETGDYGVGVYVRRLLDLLGLFFLVKFTRKPLRFFGMIGSGTLAAGALITGVLCVQRLLKLTALADRPALMFGVLMVVLGIQLFALGLLGELIIFTHGRMLRDSHVEFIFQVKPESATSAREESISC